MIFRESEEHVSRFPGSETIICKENMQRCRLYIWQVGDKKSTTELSASNSSHSSRFIARGRRGKIVFVKVRAVLYCAEYAVHSFQGRFRIAWPG